MTAGGDFTQLVTAPALLSFADASERVVAFLRETLPMGFWSVTRHEDGRQVYLTVADDVYGKGPGDSHAWDDSFCQYMVLGKTPQIAPDAMSIPLYAEAGVAQVLPIGSYVGIPIRAGDGTVFGTICGLDPVAQAPEITGHAPLLSLLSTLLGQILDAERLSAEAEVSQAELHWRAFHDPLTRLPNRAMFLDRLEHAVALHDRDRRPVALLLLDLDDFKLVNDGHGHAAGDELLVQVAGRLSALVREGDTFARLGGDEFAVLLEDGGSSGGAAARMVAALRQPFDITGHLITTGASIGVAVLEPGSAPADVGTLLARADLAMYSAKRDGKGGLAHFDPTMTLPGHLDLTLREPLRRTVLAGELDVAYQPLVDLITGEVIGFEALARWENDGESIPPDVFIPMARRAAVLPQLTDHVLDTAAAQLARWGREVGHDRLQVGVNVPPELFVDDDLPTRVGDVIARHGLQPGQLVLELTEDALLSDLAKARRIGQELVAVGARLSLDDFGTGWSSLLHLRQMPLDSLKVDRSFTRDLGTSPDADRFMRALLSLGTDLGLDVVIEGIEHPDQADALRLLGARYAQGWLFGRPLPAQQCSLDPAGYFLAPAVSHR